VRLPLSRLGRAGVHWRTVELRQSRCWTRPPTTGQTRQPCVRGLIRGTAQSIRRPGARLDRARRVRARPVHGWQSLAEPVQDWRDGTLRTGVALAAHVAPELQHFAAAFAPALAEVGSIWRQGRHHLAPRLTFRKAVDPIPPFAGAPTEAKSEPGIWITWSLQTYSWLGRGQPR